MMRMPYWNYEILILCRSRGDNWCVLDSTPQAQRNTHIHSVRIDAHHTLAQMYAQHSCTCKMHVHTRVTLICHRLRRAGSRVNLICRTAHGGP